MTDRRVKWSVLAVLLCASVLAQGQQVTIFLVRHADKVSEDGQALLSPRGKQRAECLAKTLKDANIGTIYATNVMRTQQTAEPTAKETGVEVTILRYDDVTGLVVRLKAAHENVLVVGHGDTLGPVVSQMSGGQIADFGAREYDRLIVVEMVDGRASPAVTVRYCADF